MVLYAFAILSTSSEKARRDRAAMIQCTCKPTCLKFTDVADTYEDFCSSDGLLKTGPHKSVDGMA